MEPKIYPLAGRVKQKICGKCGSQKFLLGISSDESVLILRCAGCGYSLVIEIKNISETETRVAESSQISH